MSKSKQPDPLAPRPDLDFSKGVRGKYAGRVKQAVNIVILDPDLLDTFPNSESVNEALRGLKKVAARSIQAPSRPRKAASLTR